MARRPAGAQRLALPHVHRAARGTFAETENAAQSAAQLIVLPMVLSGSFFPLDFAPGWVRSVAQVMPLHHLATATQDVISRGKGVGAALLTIGGLLALAVALCAVSLRLFRWDDA